MPLKAALAALLFRVSPTGVVSGADTLLTRTANVEDVDHFSDSSCIFGLELATVVSTIMVRRRRMASRSVSVYIDNNAAICALVAGDSSSSVAARLVGLEWCIDAVYNITLWFDRVSSAANIADFPTRGKPPPFPVSEERALPSVTYRLDFYNARMQVMLTPEASIHPNGTSPPPYSFR